MALIRKLFWIALFLVFTFMFCVIFDRGFSPSFSQNAKAEYEEMKQFLGWKPQPKKDDSDKTDK